MVTPPARSGVYRGWLRHRRRAPVEHAFTYPLFMALLDVDRIPELMRASRFTSYNSWNWASFHEADHPGDPALRLRQRLALDAATHGLALPDGPVFLLTHLRYLGFCFNPVSFFYCYDRAGTLRLILAAVNNTFGGSHNYWLEPATSGNTDSAAAPGDRPGTSEVFRATAAKAFYVSPFMPAGMRYTFSFTQPGTRLVVHMALEETGAERSPHTFDATLSLDFRPWTGREITRALMRFPLMTANVVAGIHWEALKLWWKGLPTVPRPTPDGAYQDLVAPDAGRS